MSTEPAPTTDPRPTTDSTTTEIAARRRTDRWASTEESAPSFLAARAPRQFEPACRKRLRNLMDEENAYCS